MAFVTIKDKDAATLGYLQADAQERLGVHNLLHVQHRIAASSTVGAGAFTAGAWRTRPLNTIVENNINASLLNNQVTLPHGDYWAFMSAPAYQVGQHKARLYNVTLNLNCLIGNIESAVVSISMQNSSIAEGAFSLPSESVLELQHICVTTRDSAGFGLNYLLSSDTTDSGYADLKIWKLS